MSVLSVAFHRVNTLLTHHIPIFFSQMNCDTHPLPVEHKNHLPLEQIMEKMVGDFRIARAQREPDKYPDVEFSFLTFHWW